MCQVNGIEFTDAVPVTGNHATNDYVADILSNPIEEEINPLVQEDIPTPFPAEIQQYDSLTVAELKELCSEKALTVGGTKAELILRLKQNDETDSPTEVVALEAESDAPTEEVAVTSGSEQNDQDTSSDKQEPIIEE
tara:strand:- start:917 stop:1327 length:411 start_codon:yes stop_codon:yes gene_type:complete